MTENYSGQKRKWEAYLQSYDYETTEAMASDIVLKTNTSHNIRRWDVDYGSSKEWNATNYSTVPGSSCKLQFLKFDKKKLYTYMLLFQLCSIHILGAGHRPTTIGICPLTVTQVLRSAIPTLHINCDSHLPTTHIYRPATLTLNTQVQK